ncbi:MAG: hypothetical protein MR646_02155 [Agathobacter sp.]|nr:hypothetical protein [Agathobacter sp.]
MAVFEVTRDYLEKFVDTQIEKNQVLKDFREDLVDMLVCNTPDISEDMEGESSWPFEKREPAQLYIRDSRYHIRIKDLVIDFFENVFTGALLEAMLFWFGLSVKAEVSPICITKEFILFVKRVVKEYVVKLDNTEFCIYLQVITHLKEHQEFSIDELKSWLPRETDNSCNMHTDKWNCIDMREGKCYFNQDNLDEVLQKMVLKHIMEYSENSTYRIRY